MNTFETELEAACDIAREAGNILLDYYDETDDGRVRTKAGGSPQSAADRASNAFIVAALRDQFPQDGLLAEESPDDMRRPGEARAWIVDPLDGTREFLERIGQFVVQVAFVYEGDPVVGAVYQPTTETLYYGTPGVGAYRDCDGHSTRLSVSTRERPASFRCVLSRSHHLPLSEEMVRMLGIERTERIGSVGLKVAALLEQRADLYLHPSGYTKLWDTAAPQAILHAAGGVMTDCYGRPLDYSGLDVRNRAGILASNGRAHARIATLIAPLFRRAHARGET